MKMMTACFLAALAGADAASTRSPDTSAESLRARVELSSRRLEAEKYRPDAVFLGEDKSNGWPGDTEGRTLLALVLQQEALGVKPKYLDGIMRAVPSHLNEDGYFGKVRRGVASEQQMAGNGWLLRALCEYVRVEKSPVIDAKGVARRIARGLFLANADLFPLYPVTPDARKDMPVGGASGTTAAEVSGWELSTDVGALFIGLDGLVQAWQTTGDPDLKRPIEFIIARFEAFDPIDVKAQTHATLSGIRALLRYDAKRFLPLAERRFDLYRLYGMTDRFENYNWFLRYDTWTEPCAIVDSLLLAHRLGELTGKGAYAELEKNILAALVAHQRPNGGFCLMKTFPKGTAHAPEIACEEAHWCCTMRGGAGLATALRWATGSSARRTSASARSPAPASR